MGRESTQKKLSRVRPPRVQITYDVQIGDAIEVKELPFVLGVIGDYSGHNPGTKKLREKSFVQIDRDNFDEVLRGAAPTLSLRVDNKLKNDNSQLGVNLEFNSLSDFEPQNVVLKVDALSKLLLARQRLSDLRNKIAGNDKLEQLLEDVVQNTEALQSLSAKDDIVQNQGDKKDE